MQDASAVDAWVRAMQHQNLIANWYADMQSVSLNGVTLPVALGCAMPEQTYLASPQHAYIDYARDELDVLTDVQTRRRARAGLSVVEPWLRALRLDESVSVNAWGVSTHVYPRWTAADCAGLAAQLSQRYPTRPLWIRTLHEGYDADLLQQLTQQGWQLWPSRVVYAFDWKTADQWMKQRNNQIDQKLLRKTALTSMYPEDFNANHAVVMANLYQQLYLDKHSGWNAHYTPAYFALAIEHRWLSFYGFADAQGQLIAFIGVFEDEQVMTTPMLGYDLSLPQSLGLYRLLMARVLQLGVQADKCVNLGAGSANFKRLRGGVASIEWHGFYVAHLSRPRQWAMQITGKLMCRFLPKFLLNQMV